MIYSLKLYEITESKPAGEPVRDLSIRNTLPGYCPEDTFYPANTITRSPDFVKWEVREVSQNRVTNSQFDEWSEPDTGLKRIHVESVL